MATRQPKPPAPELTADELKQINRQIALVITWHVIKRLLLVPLLFMAFIALTILGVSTSQIMHALSGEHNIRRQD